MHARSATTAADPFRRRTSRSAVDVARRAYATFTKLARDWHRKRFVLTASGLATRDPAIFFLCPDYDRPAGGIRVIYRHVDILNSAGISAFVLHRKPGFRCSWFDNATPIVALAHASIEAQDLIVVPETEVDIAPGLPAGVKHVIFNQNSHLTWRHMDGEASTVYSTNPDLAAVITVSSHNEEMLRYAFPGCPVRRVQLCVDPALFHPGTEARPRRIAYMPRRGRADSAQVIAMLRGRGVLDRWEIKALDGLPHSEVANQLRTSRIFLAFTGQEGFGLPAAEAMACGNYVIGNHGFGGLEFFREDFCAPVESGDVLGFAQTVEKTIRREEENDGWCESRGRQAAAFISSTYGPDQERGDVVRTYADIMASSLRPAC